MRWLILRKSASLPFAELFPDGIEVTRELCIEYPAGCVQFLYK